MKRINSLVQKLASIAPKAARLAISSGPSTHKVTHRLLPFIAALATAGSLSAAATQVQACNYPELQHCMNLGYSTCTATVTPPSNRAVKCSGSLPSDFGHCPNGALYPDCGPLPTALQRRPVLPGSVTDASTTVASQEVSRDQPAKLSPVAGPFSAAAPGQSRAFEQQPITLQLPPLPSDSVTDAAPLLASQKESRDRAAKSPAALGETSFD
jgi:hypothetical protein